MRLDVVASTPHVSHTRACHHSSLLHRAAVAHTPAEAPCLPSPAIFVPIRRVVEKLREVDDACSHVSAVQDALLREAVRKLGKDNWKRVAETFDDRTDVQCQQRWTKNLNPNLVKGPWTAEEDAKVIELVNIHGAKKWSLIADHLPGRIGKQCRERFVAAAAAAGLWFVGGDRAAWLTFFFFFVCLCVCQVAQPSQPGN